MTETLFPELVPVPLPEPEPVEKLSADRRRTLRQRRDVERGIHPLNGLQLVGDGSTTCGNCAFRELFTYHRRSYPKCTARDGVYLTHGPASDVRAWWPSCPLWEPDTTDPKVSPDAARWKP